MNRLIVALGLIIVAAFAAFVIWFVSNPTPSSEGPSVPAIQTVPSADAFMNVNGSGAVRPYGFYTNELVIQPSECNTPAEGVAYLRVGDICTVSVDRGMYPSIYGRGLSANFDTTSPLNSETLFVVQLKGTEPFSIFLLKEGFADDTQRLPDGALMLGDDTFGFDIRPDSVAWNLDNPLADPN